MALVLPPPLVAVVAGIIAVIISGGCASSKPTTPTADASASVATPVAPAPATTVRARALAAPPAAVRTPDAPGLNVEDLAARLRDAVDSTSGIEVVDELSVRRELAACQEAPCPDVVAARYRDAAFVIASSVSRVGDVFLATVRVQRGADEMARTSAQARDAREALETAGRAAGALLRDQLVHEGVGEQAEGG